MKLESSIPSMPVNSSAYPWICSMSPLSGPWDTYLPRHPDMFITVPPDISHSSRIQEDVPSYSTSETAPAAIRTATEERSASGRDSASSCESQNTSSGPERIPSCSPKPMSIVS